jgi:hypothetical protein
VGAHVEQVQGVELHASLKVTRAHHVDLVDLAGLRRGHGRERDGHCCIGYEGTASARLRS